MRIALVSDHPSPEAAGQFAGGGRQRQLVTELARQLVRHGHQVSVYTHRRDPGQAAEQRRAEGYRVVRLGVELGPQLGDYAAALARCWRRERPDVVHAHHWTSGLAALLAARSVAVPVVQTFHELGSSGGRPRHTAEESRRLRLQRLVARRADLVLATNSDEAAALVALGVHRPRITVVPYGVDTSLFAADPPRTHPDRPFRVLTTGTGHTHSGVRDVLVSVARLPSVELVVAGDSDRSAPLSELVHRFGMAERVRMVGRVPRVAFARLLRAADLVVCAPWHEASGLVALEAMASGIAVLATEVGGLTDLVVPGHTGELVPPGRPEVLATTLARLVVDRVTLQAYGTAGRDRAESSYTWDRIAAAVARSYAEAAGQPRPGLDVPA